MERLLSYLGKEVRGSEIISLIAKTAIAGFLWSFSAAFLLIDVFGVNLGEEGETGIPLLSWYAPLIIFLAAAFEEAIFRFIPLRFGVARWGISKKVLLVAGFSSVLFGLAHGSIYNIPIQGVSGFLFSCVFLKCGGFRKKYLKALLCSTLTHFSYNGILALVLLLGGVVFF